VKITFFSSSQYIHGGHVGFLGHMIHYHVIPSVFYYIVQHIIFVIFMLTGKDSMIRDYNTYNKFLRIHSM